MRYLKLVVYILCAMLYMGCVSPKEPAGLCEVRIDADDYTVLEWTEVAVSDGDTVIEITKRVTRDSELQMEFSGSGITAYVKGIDNLYEFDKGPTSGWIYRVNGEAPSKSSGGYTIKDGDKIEWIYTMEADEE